MSDSCGVGTQVYAFVDGITLIPQDQTNACWYASMMMVHRWRSNRGGNAPNVLRLPEVQAVYQANNGMPWADMQAFARGAGMEVAPLMTPSPQLLASWLERYGPLWTDGMPVDWQGRTAGNGHVVVLAGIRSVPSSDLYEVYVYDPWPPNQGHEGWRPISHLVAILRAGTNPARNVFFMHYP